MNKLKITAAALFFCIAVAVTAEAQNIDGASMRGSSSVYHELSFGGTAATSGILQTFNVLQTLDNQKTKVKSSFNAGGGLQINYTLHFNESISLTFGAAAKYSQSTYGFDQFYEKSNQKWQSNSTEDTFLLSANISDYTETHRAVHVQVPLLFGYETGGAFAKWYINAGVAAQFTVYGKYSAKISRLTTTGYSPYNNGYLNDIPYLGLGTKDDIDGITGKPTLKFTVNGYFETGAKIFTGKGSWMYIGIFGEISALRNSISETGSSKSNLINYTPSEVPSNELMDNLSVTSITNTRHTSGGRTYAFGGIIRFGFDFLSSNRMLSNQLRGNR